jgi:hypothetical protein
MLRADGQNYEVYQQPQQNAGMQVTSNNSAEVLLE